MKKQFLSLAAIAFLGLGIASCSNSTNDTATTDSTSATNTTASTANTTTTSTSTSTNNYAALSDSVKANTAKGYYLNPKTGKPYSKLTVDTATGSITTETGEPVWRYVDKRTWNVYGGNDWQQQGQAKMEGEKLMYQDSSNKWVDYGSRWSKDDEDNIKKWKESDNGNKVKMVTESGDKMKVKTDEEGNTKIKANGDKMKVDSNGNVKH